MSASRAKVPGWLSKCARRRRTGGTRSLPVGHRRQGVAGELLLGVIDFARAQGAARLEACAVDLAEAGRVPSADLYRGPLSVYLAGGFQEISRTSASWVLVGRTL